MGAGFGTNPRSFALKVTIVGHASPRWKGAKGPAEADRLNAALAQKRAIAVRDATIANLKRRLGEDVAIEFDLSYADGERPKLVAVGTSSVGSRVSLERAQGDRTNNDASNRAVELAVELITTKHATVGRSVPQGRISAYTKFWYLSIKSLLVIGTVVPGPMTAFLELQVKNSLSKKTALYRATLFGGGDPMPLSDTPDKNVGRSDAPIVTDEPIGFDDFNNKWIRLSRMDLQVAVGVARYYCSIPELGKGAYNYMGQEFGVGLPGGFVSTGPLQMAGKNPGDWFDSDLVMEESYVVEVDGGRKAEAILLTFPTGSANLADLSATDKKKLDKVFDIWERRLTL